jgi:hypothetical protein
MPTRTVTQIKAEIEALQQRIRRLRLERKISELTLNERRLLQIAQRKDRVRTSTPAKGEQDKTQRAVE